MVRLIADEFLTEERDRKYYADHYKCWPPPLFVIAVTLIQVSTDNSLLKSNIYLDIFCDGIGFKGKIYFLLSSFSHC